MLKLSTQILLLICSFSLGSLVQGQAVFGGTNSSTPLLAGVPGKDCVKTFFHEGTPVGTVVPLGGMDTYLSVPQRPFPGPSKILIYFADIYGPLYENAKLIQDQYAANGYTVLGPDYFFGDPIWMHDNDPNFDIPQWFANKTEVAHRVTPLWLEAVKQKYGANGPNIKYTVVGYCFGAPYAMDVAATDDVVAASFAHPSFVTEEQFQKVKKPLLMSLAENDSVYSYSASRRAEDILVQRKAQYYIQAFSGTSHGFVSRGDPNNTNIQWAQRTAIKSVIEWGNRFSI